MRYLAILGYATLALISVFFQPALAHVGGQEGHNISVVRLHNNISVAGGATYQNYKEHQQGKTLDKETGWIPNIKASISYMSPKHYLLSGGIRYSFGETNYTGADLFTGAPINNQTKNKIANVNLKIGKGFLISDRFMITPFATYGHRYWDRNLANPAQEEYYNLNYLGAGVMLDYQATPRLILSAQAMGAGTFANTMYASGAASLYQANFHFQLGSKPLAKAALKADYRFYRDWHLFGTVHYTYFQFGKSDQNALTFYEPKSKTRNVSLDLGVRYTY